MADIDPQEYIQTNVYEKYGFSEPISVFDYSVYSSVKDFEYTLDQTTPVGITEDTVDFYKNKGKVDPESESATSIADELLKGVVVFTDTLTKQLGMLAEDQLNRQLSAHRDLTNLITLGINALFGVATGAFNFNVFSILGSIFSAIGFSSIGGLISNLGGAFDNIKKAQEEEERVGKEAGKNVAAAVKATKQVAENPEGNNLSSSNVDQITSNVINRRANVAVNIQTPFQSVAANTYVQTSTDHVVTSNFYKANHTYASITADNAFNITARHSTRYFTASVVEIAAQADYIASHRSCYADFRWTQTGQGFALPIANPLEGLVNQLFKVNGCPLPGVSIDMSTFAKLTTANLFNINYGRFYTIDGFVMINSGLGSGLAAIPPRLVANITDIPTPQTVQRQDPQAFVSVNNKTYETLYQNNSNFEGVNLGQLFTKAENQKAELEEKYNDKN